MNLGDWDSVTEIPSQLFPSEHIFLRDFAKRVSEEFENPTIVNIGIWRGASMYCLRVGAPTARLVGIDVMGTYSFVTNGLVEFLKAKIIKRNSNYVYWTDPIHLAFIDGGHEYKVVEEDIHIYGGRIVKGGYVIFHDSKRDEVWQAIEDCMFVTQWEDLNIKCATLQVFRRK